MAKRLFKFTLSLFLAFVLVMSAAANGGGAIDYDAKIKELEEKADRIKEQNKRRENKINELKNNVNQQQTYINEVNAQISAINDQIDAYRNLVAAMTEKIENTESVIADKETAIAYAEKLIAGREDEISRLDEKNKDNILKFGEIIKRSYKTGDADTFNLIMGSTDFYGLLISAKLIKNTNEKNVEFMNELLDAISDEEEAIAALERERERLNDDKKSLEKQKLDFEKEKAELVQEMNSASYEVNSQYNKLYSLAEDKAELERQMSDYRQQINASNSEVEEINAAVAELIREKQRANNPSYGTGFIWPLDPQYKKITCNFGYDSWRGGMHYGTDIGNAGIGGANIYAMQSGVVLVAYNDGGRHGGYGNYVVIDHGGGVSTLYAHSRTGTVRVQVGDTVSQGDLIASVGQTGWATGDHLHFEVRIDGKAVDPMQYF